MNCTLFLFSLTNIEIRINFPIRKPYRVLLIWFTGRCDHLLAVYLLFMFPLHSKMAIWFLAINIHELRLHAFVTSLQRSWKHNARLVWSIILTQVILILQKKMNFQNIIIHVLLILATIRRRGIPPSVCHENDKVTN